MPRPINIKRFANLLSADEALERLERVLKREGDFRKARKLADVRTTLRSAMEEEQEELYRKLVDLI